MNSAPPTDAEKSSVDTYWHLKSAPWHHMVPLFKVLSKHFGKSYDEVAELIGADTPLIHNLLSEWSSAFQAQKASLEPIVAFWAETHLYPKWYSDMPWLKEEHDRRGRPKEKYQELEEAEHFFCFFPFNEYFYPICYDYDHLKKDYTEQYGSDLVSAMKHDFGITLKYPHLPLFGAKLNNEVDYWPMEAITVSVAVPLILNLDVV